MNKKLLILKSKSPKYIAFRTWHYFRQRTGILEKQFPVDTKDVFLPTLADFRESKSVYFFKDRSSLHFQKVKSAELQDNLNHVLKGDVLFFGKQWKNLGLDYDWITNPTTNFKYNINTHWSKIESLSKEAGDIKFVWEKSRFSFVYAVIKYDYHYDEDHAKFVFDQILDWIDKNPLNCGPNYKCSQEISLRLQNWIFALNFYKNSDYLTDDLWNKIIKSIYWQTEHVYHNINYSRISVRNNHAITETLTLYIIGLLFPMLPNAAKWKRDGKRWFEKEIDYQIEPDGTYLQDSMNYHRVVVQLLTWAISLADKNNETFKPFVYEKAYQSVNFLFQCQDEESGWLPNYGSNDGALFFPLSSADFRDYRPQLDALHFLLTGKPLYTIACEDTQWVATKKAERCDFPLIKKQQGLVKFEKSGFYIIRENRTMTFIRCGNFKKQGTADQLHIDIWHDGKNMLFDCGTYKYNTTEELRKYFAGTESHNTIMIDGYDQMLKGPRFMWFYPPKICDVLMSETELEYIFSGTVRMFRHVGDDIIITRTIKKIKGKTIWTIEDIAKNLPQGQTLRQLWHTIDNTMDFVSSGKREEKKSFFSSYYGIKGICRQVEFHSKDNNIITTISL